MLRIIRSRLRSGVSPKTLLPNAGRLRGLFSDVDADVDVELSLRSEDEEEDKDGLGRRRSGVLGPK